MTESVVGSRWREQPLMLAIPIGRPRRPAQRGKWVSDLRADCPKRNATQLHERCDLIYPDLPKVL